MALLACIGSPALAQQESAAPPDSPAPAAPDPSGQVGQTGPQSSPAPPQKKSFFSRYIDDEDHGLDFSKVLAKGGFIPVPIIITEPAVDKGYGLAAAFLSADPNDPRHVTKHVAGAFKTGNGSWGIGYVQAGYLFDGRLNYRAILGHGKVTLDAFPAFAPGGIAYTSHYDYGIVGTALWRLGNSGLSVGPLLDFRKLRSNLDLNGLPSDFASDFNHTLHTGALGLGVHFDSRDNPITPRRGTNAYVDSKFNRGTFGSDRDYETYDAELYTFNTITSDLRYGFKLELNAIRGDFPFFYAPAINLRGVQMAQYQGVNVISSELEITWRLSPRWSLLAFSGVGATDAGNRRLFRDSGAIWAGGGGFRYLIARKLGIDAGMDFAYGPGGFTFYIQFGHAWSFGMD